MTGRRGNLIVVSAPSGSGKTTLVQHLLEADDRVRFSVSFTTRAKRGREQDGVDYHFVSEATFREKIERGELLEWAEVYENLYGTSRVTTDAVLAEGDDVLLDVDVQGAAQVRKAQPDAVTIFIMPPSFAALESRLVGREQDTPAVIKARLEEAHREIRHYAEYDYVLINDDVETTGTLLSSVVRAERARPRRLEHRIQPILDSFA